ncbi:hypothetical protein HanPSC8_Chr17g0780701 [Helianthus annuus]|nr:hypothetical protein HanPSC8_Chr17g0780701 [Helianthus annuus]
MCLAKHDPSTKNIYRLKRVVPRGSQNWYRRMLTSYFLKNLVYVFFLRETISRVKTNK